MATREPGLWKPLGASLLINALLLLGVARLLPPPAAPPRLNTGFVVRLFSPSAPRRTPVPPPHVRPAQSRPVRPRTPAAVTAPASRHVSVRPRTAPSKAFTPPSFPAPAEAASTTAAPGGLQTAALPVPDGQGEAVPSSAPGDGQMAFPATSAPGGIEQSSPVAQPSDHVPDPPTEPPPTAAPPHSGPTRGARVVVSSQPPYPPSARQDGVEGTVTLRVSLDTDGSVQGVEVLTSSGDRRLDEAARQEIIAHWRFAPRLEAGAPTAGTLRVRVVFTLTDEA